MVKEDAQPSKLDVDAHVEGVATCLHGVNLSLPRGHRSGELVEAGLSRVRLVSWEGGDAEVHQATAFHDRRPMSASATSRASRDHRDVVDAERVGAVQEARTFDATVPPSRSSASRPVIAPMKRLRDVPTMIGRQRSRSSPRRRRSSRLCSTSCRSRCLGRSRSAPRQRRQPRRLDPLVEERLDVVHDVFVAGVLLHRPRRRRACASGTTSQPRSAQSRRGPGSPRSAVTSLTIWAPASSAAAATSAFEVSIETGMPGPASASTTGSHAPHSSWR